MGRGVETYAAGEIWHLLDHRFGIPLPMIEMARWKEAAIGRYLHLILAAGKYDRLGKETVEKIRRWIEGGGVLVALQGAATWAERTVLRPSGDGEKSTAEAAERHDPKARARESGSPEGAAPEQALPEDPNAKVERRPYVDASDDRAAQQINGAIFRVELDATHPLAFGYPRSERSVFRNTRTILEPSPDPYADAPLVSGYVSAENLAELQGTPAIIAERVGRGAVIRMVDGPNFRAFWYGTNKLFLNALFFGGLLEDTSPPP